MLQKKNHYSHFTHCSFKLMDKFWIMCMETFSKEVICFWGTSVSHKKDVYIPTSYSPVSQSKKEIHKLPSVHTISNLGILTSANKKAFLSREYNPYLSTSKHHNMFMRKVVLDLSFIPWISEKWNTTMINFSYNLRPTSLSFSFSSQYFLHHWCMQMSP